MDKNVLETLKKVAKMLEDLGAKYNIPQQELEQIAQACGAAVADASMQEGAEQVPGQAPAQEPLPPMDTEADELAGALGGR